MKPSVDQVVARLARLRLTYTLERSVGLRLRELRALCELTRYLQSCPIPRAS